MNWIGVIIGAVIIAGAIMIVGRYSLVAGGADATDGLIVWRLDHWTGNVSRCQSASLFCQSVKY